jgi:DNA-binding transcriptional MerR regulator
MKISEFANKYKVSNDTIRYYMDLNLITPEKKGGHYFFDEGCELQLKKTLELKKMNFSLQEIKKIFNFKRMGKLTSYQRNNYYQNIYEGKVQETEEEIVKLNLAKDKLEENLTDLKSKGGDERITIGIGLDALSLFACPQCNNDLTLTADKVEANQIIEGSLNCKCGESLTIKDGILYANNLDDNLEYEEEVEANHIEKYIKTTDPDFIDKSYESLEWLQRHFGSENLSGKVILEPGSGYGHFLRQIYNDLPDNSTYICIDHNPQKNKYLKRLLERTGKRANIVFITSELPELPLQESMVDLLIDFTGTSSYAFENKGFLPELLDDYLKQQSNLFGSFIIYKKFGSHNIVARPFRKNFMYNTVKDKLLNQGFELEETYKSDIEKIEKTMGKYEDFAQIGDRIYSYQVKAKREE